MEMMDVGWNEAPGAETYEVQYFNMRGWVDLPGDGIRIAFYGAGAIVQGADAFSAFTSVIRTLERNGGDQPVVDRLCAVFSGPPVHSPSV